MGGDAGALARRRWRSTRTVRRSIMPHVGPDDDTSAARRYGRWCPASGCSRCTLLTCPGWRTPRSRCWSDALHRPGHGQPRRYSRTCRSARRSRACGRWSGRWSSRWRGGDHFHVGVGVTHGAHSYRHRLRVSQCPRRPLHVARPHLGQISRQGGVGLSNGHLTAAARSSQEHQSSRCNNCCHNS